MKASLPPLPQEPLVSVLTTSYNHRPWVQDTVNSVAAQTYERIEHVIVENGSTDGSQELLRTIAGGQLIEYLPENIEQPPALNRAFELSHGQIIGWLNSDDVYFSPRVVERVVGVFRSHPRVAAVYGHAVVIDSDGLVQLTNWASPHTRLARSLLRFYFVAPTLFVRREAVGPAFVDGTFDIANDTDLYLRLASRYSLRRVGAILAGERHHGRRKSYTLTSRMLEEDKILEGRYGRQRSLLGVRMSKLVMRAMGITLIPAASSQALAFAGRRDGMWSLLRRQLLRRRKDL